MEKNWVSITYLAEKHKITPETIQLWYDDKKLAWTRISPTGTIEIEEHYFHYWLTEIRPVLYPQWGSHLKEKSILDELLPSEVREELDQLEVEFKRRINQRLFAASGGSSQPGQ
jgi:hypothetical protein